MWQIHCSTCQFLAKSVHKFYSEDIWCSQHTKLIKQYKEEDLMIVCQTLTQIEFLLHLHCASLFTQKCVTFASWKIHCVLEMPSHVTYFFILPYHSLQTLCNDLLKMYSTELALSQKWCFKSCWAHIFLLLRLRNGCRTLWACMSMCAHACAFYC